MDPSADRQGSALIRQAFYDALIPPMNAGHIERRVALWAF